MDLTILLMMFISFTFEMLVAAVMLVKHPLKFRFKPYISIPVGLLIAFGSAFLVIFPLWKFVKPEQWNEFINIVSYLIPTIGIFGALLFAYKMKVPQLVLLLSVAYTFQHMAYQWSTLLIDVITQTTLFNTLGQDVYFQNYQTISIFTSLGTHLVRVGIFTVSYFLIAKPFKKYFKYILRTLNIIVLGIVVFLVCNVANTYVVQHLSWDAAMRGIMAGTLIIFCIVFDTLVVGGFLVMEHRQETTIIKATLQSKVRQQEMMEKNINFINMKCHDLRKELRRLKDKKSTLTDEDFCLLEESLNFYDSSIKTGDINIDALIQDKLIYCNSLGIEFTALVDGDAFKEIDSSDVYFLLVNIIDNAIEATERIGEKEHRIISLTASKKQGVLFIEETNYFNGELVFNSDGSIKTTKTNSKYHGYGTKSIAYIVKKYEGKVEYEVKEHIFKLKIVI